MALSSPQRVLAALGSLDNNEIAELARWGTPEYPVETSLVCVVTRFEQQVRATPNARAISFAADNRWISFEQLDQAASRLAGWLMARGVKPGVHIALCLPRGIEFVTAMLAVMKSGAAWVPVDPGYPKELMNHMVSDSQAKMLITDRSSRPDLDAVDIVLLEDIENQPDLSVTEALASSWPVDRPAYVIYTSGSTGVPKGVVISHLALACHAQSVIQSYALNPSDRILQFASLSFDVSIEEIVPTLVAGAELVLRHNEAAESVSSFLQLVHDHKLTVLNLPTSFWHTCVEQMGLSGSVLPESVRLLIVGGEKASPGILEQWRRTHPSLHWINAYGPTETTISCTFYELPRNGPLPNGSDVPIGRPLGHARAVVLAIDGSLAPPGAQGELCIAGPGLSSGYLGLESANAERFTSVEGSLDPLLLQWGWNRLYRTGDDARWDPLGQLRFLGRRDRQVKVRGFRVELRTVEHAVEQIAGVAECVVRVERPGEPQARLLAWVLPRPGAQLTEAGLDAALVVSLPLHMRPAIKLVTSWPKTPGGKIDVHRLPVHGPKVDPTAPLQAQSKEVIRMAALFAQVLKRESVGPNDSFFDLGGHSLMAVSLIATVERELGQRVSVSTLKACPTPAGLHAALTKGDDQNGPQFLVVIQPGDQTALPIYGVHSIGHRERFYRPLSRRLGLAQPLFGLTTGYTHLHEQDLSVEQLGKLYFEDIQKHRPQGPLVLAAVSMCAYVAYELAKQLTTAGREVAYLVLFDSEGPDGRPSLQSKAQVLALHWRQLRKKGPRYLLDRLITRLTESGGIRSRMGLMLGQRMGLTRSQSFDHPADHAFVENLAQAVSRYTPGQYRGNIVIFYPQDEPFFDLDEAARTGLGWRSCTTGSIDLTPVPGNHISMLDEPHVGVMAHKLSQLISDWKSSEIDRTS